MHSRRTAPQLREAVHDDVRPLRSGLTGQRSQARVDRGRGEILLYGEIGPSEWGMVDAEAFARILKDLGDVTVIDLRINSYGGFADEGIAIYSQLVRHPAQVNVTVDGIAASIASVSILVRCVRVIRCSCARFVGASPPATALYLNLAPRSFRRSRERRLRPAGSRSLAHTRPSLSHHVSALHASAPQT